MNRRTKWNAVFLAFLLGDIGTHRYYLGQPQIGLAYVLLFWTGLPRLVSIVEVFYFLLMSKQQFNLRFNKDLRLV